MDTELNPWLLVACLLTAWVLIVVRVAVATHEELALLSPHVHASFMAPPDGHSRSEAYFEQALAVAR